MADYKVVNATQLDDDLASVAEAIKIKGGTDESLEFPNGFVDAVNAIESGGGEIPLKGFVPTEWNSDGWVTKGTLYGIAEIPNGFFAIADNVNNASFFRYLESVDFDEDIISFGSQAFYGLSNLLMTECPPTLKTIGVNCFRYCSKISFDTIPDYVSEIGSNTFTSCSNLKLNKLPASLTLLGAYAFQRCNKITISEIPEGVTSIGIQCFAYCNALTSMTFKGTPTSIATNAFSNNSGLVNIYVPWAEGEVENAPWGATNATIHYNTTYDENSNPIVTEV